MKKIVAIISVVVIALTLSSCVKTDNNIDNYVDDVKAFKASSFMPDLDNIGDYNDVQYFSRKDEGSFPAYSMQLVVTYDEEGFLKEKEKLNTTYTYLEAPQKADFDDTVYTIPIEEFSAVGYDFKIAEFEDTVYPKNFGMVGVSEDKFKIVYLWIYAPDLDYICETNANEIKEMNEFLEQYFSLE